MPTKIKQKIRTAKRFGDIFVRNEKKVLLKKTNRQAIQKERTSLTSSLIPLVRRKGYCLPSMVRVSVVSVSL